jgi:uncharacterized membrane protein (UPF0127 family)
MLIEPCSSIHMMFMRVRIDAIFVSRDHTVTKVARNVPTWRGLSWGGSGTTAVLEIPAGAADGVEVGHRLAFV